MNRPAEAGPTAVLKPALQSLPGFCRVCQQPCNFQIDFDADDAAAHINWKKTLVCGRCGLNNSRRLTLSVILGILGGVNGASRRSVYLDCPDSSLTASAKSLMPHVDWQTSWPWDGQGARGQYSDGERHEDPQSLTFADGSFDVIVWDGAPFDSAQQEQAARELRRVMKDGGRLLVMPPQTEADRRGWALPDLLTRAGLRNTQGILCWSRLYGHLGPAQVYYHAEK